MTDNTARLSTIGELASTFKVSLRTLRFYEEAGLIEPVRMGNARYYSAQDRLRLELIQKGKLLGFSLREIKSLLHEGQQPFADEPGIGALVGREAIERQIDRLEDQRARIDDALRELRSVLVSDEPEQRDRSEEERRAAQPSSG